MPKLRAKSALQCLLGGRRMLLVGLLALVPAGCGYSSGVRLPGEAQSVGVEVFGNLSPYPELERELFACLSSQASRMINGELVAPARADVVIRGEIDDYRRLHGVQSAQGRLQESGVRIMLHAWLEERQSGLRIGDVLHFDQAVRYILDVREQERGARRAVLEVLCQEIVLDLFNQPADGISSPPEPGPSPLEDELE